MVNLEKVWNKFPVISLFNIVASPNKGTNYLKMVGHTLYGLTGILVLGLISNGVWTPNDYKEFCNKRKELIRQEEIVDNSLFGENGFVDKNNDGKPSTLEKAEYLIRAGRETELMDRINAVYPIINFEEKKKALKSYKSGEKIE